jgi:Holliday junction DNA helicase RuvB
MARALRNFNGFQGQQHVVERLKALINAYLLTGNPFAVLLVGGSGMGKNRIADAVAAEQGHACGHRLLARPDTTFKDVFDAVKELESGDVLYIDEAHALSQAVQEFFFTIIDEYKVPAFRDGHFDGTEFTSVGKITLIFGTSEPGRICRALRNRLIPLPFRLYTIRELRGIAQQVALSEHGIELTGQAAGQIARIARGTPRIVLKYLKEIVAGSPGATQIGVEDVKRFRRIAHLDQFGLGPDHYDYLRALRASPMSFRRLVNRSRVGARWLEEEIEQPLLDEGFIEIVGSNRARALTDSGRLLIASTVMDDALPRDDDDTSDEDENAPFDAGAEETGSC